MSTTEVTTGEPTGSAPQRPWRDRKRYLWPLATVMPAMPFAGAGLVALTGSPVFWWLGPMILFVILPALDLLFVLSSFSFVRS